MEIILLENIKNLGKIGDVVNVNNGFGRNFLIKQKKGLYATKENIQDVKKKKEKLNQKDLDVKKEAQKISEIINKKTFTIQKLATENNELYGSVKPIEISKLISDKKKIEIKPSQIDLGVEIKAIGTYTVNINLHAEVQAQIVIQVQKSQEQSN